MEELCWNTSLYNIDFLIQNDFIQHHTKFITDSSWKTFVLARFSKSLVMTYQVITYKMTNSNFTEAFSKPCIPWLYGI